MDEFLATLDARLTASALMVAMLLTWGIALWLARRRPPELRSTPQSKFIDASLALLGLLLAFTFSLSLAKHEGRRAMIVTGANAIGDFYACAGLIEHEPVRDQLRGVLRAYLEQRLAAVREELDERRFQEVVADADRAHARMHELVRQALASNPPVAVPLVNTLNALTSSFEARQAAWRDRLPGSIVLLLFIASIVSMALMGTQQGESGDPHIGAALGFMVLVAAAVWVTLDLNQPKRGFITVSAEPITRLLSTMGR